jgi:hypothetical protein
MAAVLSAIPAEARAATGWTKSGNYWYYYNTSGVKLTGWQILPSRAGTDRFYLDPDTNPSGQMVMGWQKIPRVTGKWYYFDPGVPGNEYGAVLMGWQSLPSRAGSDRFYLDPATSPPGQMVMGWQKIPRTGGKWYFFEPADEYGAMLTGWQYISGDWYYFDKTTASTRGQMLTGWQILLDGSNFYEFYFLGGDNGRMVTGGALIGFDWYLFGDRGGPNEGRNLKCSASGTNSGMPSRTLSVRLGTLTSSEVGSMYTALGRWNSAGVGASVSVNSSSASYIVMNRSPDVDLNILGTYQRGSNSNYFSITLFDASITAKASQWGWNRQGQDKSDLVTFVAMHEVGHALRLVDNPAPLAPSTSGGSVASVMNHMAPPRVVNPTVYDKENVRKCYEP